MDNSGKVVIERIFKSAQELLDFLSPTRDSFGRGDWVFRGHSRATWEPLPTLYRNPKVDIVQKMFAAFFELVNRSDVHKSWPKMVHSELHFQTQITQYLESKLLRDFTAKANKIGLPVPDVEKILNQPGDDFPNFPIYETMEIPDYKPKSSGFQNYLRHEQFWPGLYAGLAQHHQIPTKLLDFSYNAMNAVHFAVSPQEANDICVWAINSKYFQPNMLSPWEDFMFQVFSKRMLGIHSVMKMPNSTNSFLHHQQGLFIYPIFPYDFYFCNARYPTFIDHLDLFANHIPYEVSRPHGDFAYKLILPKEHYSSLKVLIRKLGITLSSLMPTYDNVAAEIRSETSFRFD